MGRVSAIKDKMEDESICDGSTKSETLPAPGVDRFTRRLTIAHVSG